MKKLLMILLLVPLLITAVWAEGGGVDVSGVEEGLDEETREISGELVTDGSYDVDGAIARLFAKVKEELADRAREELNSLTRIIAIAAVCTTAEAVCSDKKASELIALCACSAVTLCTLGPVDGLMSQMLHSLTALNDYSRAAMPAVFTAAAASGAVLSSGAKYAAVCLSLDIIMELTHKLTVPLICAYLAMCVCRAVFPNAIVGAAVNVAKWLAVTVMTFLTIGTSAYIGLVSALTGSADAAAVKAAKTVISTALPVVGGIISDAASTVLASAGVIKSSAGVFALIGVCALCIAPFAAIGVKMLVFRLCSAIASALDGSRLAALLGDISGALAMMLGVLGSMTIMLFISFMAAIRTVSP